ncbi:MAG: hypothetical protein WKF62_02085 [Solirubrobacterales bacterium]
MDARRLAALLFMLAASIFAGCGEGDQPTAKGDGFPPVAEPADSPPLETEPVGDVIPVGSGAEGLIADGETGVAALGVREPPSLELIDLDRFEIARTVPLASHPRHLQLERPGGPVLVPAEDSDELFRVDLESGFAEAVGVGDFPHDATALGDRVFVGDEMGDTLSVIEGDEVVETVNAPVQPGSVVASSGLIAVIAVAERVLTVYDPETLEELGTVDAGEGPTHIRTIGDRSYVIDTQGDAILEYEITRSGAELVDETSVEGTPYGVGVDARRRRLWVTLTELNEAVEFSTGRQGLEEIGRYPTVEQPNTIAVDPRDGTAVVAGATEEGTLQRITPSGD